MIAFPCAKINIGLRILEQRADRFHDLETLFVSLSLCDILEILPRNPSITVETKEDSSSSIQIRYSAEGDCLVERGIIPDGALEGHTIFRVVKALRRQGYDIPPLHIDLLKQIPFGAGLGGGSADAAEALKVLCRLFSLPLSLEDKHKLLAEIGSDCPFFLYDTPMFASGRGEILSPYELSSEVLSSFVTLIKPPFAISTKEAYQGVVRHPEVRGQLRNLLCNPLEQWRGTIVNDFEESLFLRYRQLSQIKDSLYHRGASFVLLSGSGSAIYALSSSPLAIERDSSLWKSCFFWQGHLGYNFLK